MLKDRSKVMPKFLAVVQLLVLISKLDGTLTCQWSEVYFGFLLVCFVGVLVLVSMGLFWVVDVLSFRGPLISTKHAGLGFISLQALSAILAAMLPLAETTFRLPFLGVGLSGMLINLGTIGYDRIFNERIILFMCKVEKVKGFNQIVTLVSIPDLWIEQYVFRRKSENWYERVTKSHAALTGEHAESQP
jgi:hypothetical protein